MNKVIHLAQRRKPISNPGIPPQDLANILSKAIDCLEPKLEVRILSFLLDNSFAIVDGEGRPAEAAAVLNEGRSAVHDRSELRPGVLRLSFPEGVTYDVSSTLLLDPYFSEEIRVGLDLEHRVNSRTLRFARLQMQLAMCPE